MVFEETPGWRLSKEDTPCMCVLFLVYTREVDSYTTMPQCSALKTDGAQCSRQSHPRDNLPPHLHFCNQHHEIYDRRRILDGDHLEGRCVMFGTNHWCPREAVEGHKLCAHHQTQMIQREARRDAARTMAETVRIGVETLLQIVPRPTWQEAVQQMGQVPVHTPGEREIARRVAFHYYTHPAVRQLDIPIYQTNAPHWRFHQLWNWAEQGAVGQPPDVDAPPPTPPVATLARLAADSQNVHTTAVSNQTNRGMDQIRETVVPKDQQTEKTIITAWISVLPMVGWGTILKTAEDVNRWFNTKHCRSPNDMLYRGLLRGLVARINQTEKEVRPELFKRLWEECHEATGLCCEGHLTRLCNVMVGFDEAFQPPVSLGELIQQKMSAISGMDVGEEEKRQIANAWFDEVAVPLAERTAWLEAF